MIIEHILIGLGIWTALGLMGFIIAYIYGAIAWSPQALWGGKEMLGCLCIFMGMGFLAIPAVIWNIHLDIQDRQVRRPGAPK